METFVNLVFYTVGAIMLLVSTVTICLIAVDSFMDFLRVLKDKYLAKDEVQNEIG